MQRICKCCQTLKGTDDFQYVRGKQCKSCYAAKNAAKHRRYYKEDPEYRRKRRIIERRYDRSPKGIAVRIANIYAWFRRNPDCSERGHRRMMQILRSYEFSLDRPLCADGGSFHNIVGFEGAGNDKVVRKF